jgi:aspartate/methionine/tyrosine aminotransferase
MINGQITTLALLIFVTIISLFSLNKLAGSEDLLDRSRIQICNGNGKIYADNPNKCDCFDCYTGKYCDIPVIGCTINDVGGNPELHQQYWEMKLPEIQSYTTLVESPDYRTGYEHFSHLIYEDDGLNIGSTITPSLNAVIRKLHKQVGNAEVDGYNIVLGTGGAGLISAAIWALSTIHRERTNRTQDVMRVFARTPFFGAYRNWANMYPSSTQWNASYEQWDSVGRMIEFVTSPNNPSGKVTWEPHYHSKYTVYDMVYYWPYLTDTSYKANKDIMIFSLSKLTGHAGTRFGWALVKDREIAEKMSNFIIRVEVHTSIDAQHRALKVLSHLVGPQAPNFFSYLRNKMQERWKRVITVFAKGPMANRFSVESEPGQFYLWIKCLRPNENCYNYWRSRGIQGWPGDDFGSEIGRYVRLELVVRDHVFELMMKIFEKIAIEEKDSKS